MIAVKDVPCWFESKGIGHAVSSGGNEFPIYIACGNIVSFGGETTKKLPKRICRKCRLALKDAKLLTGKDKS